jgi:hypothetical protein
LPGGWLAEWSENDKRVTYLHVPSRALCPHHPVPSPVDLLSHRVCMPTTLQPLAKLIPSHLVQAKAVPFATEQASDSGAAGKSLHPNNNNNNNGTDIWNTWNVASLFRCSAEATGGGAEGTPPADTGIFDVPFSAERCRHTNRCSLTWSPPQEAQTNGCARPPNRRRGGLPLGGMQGSSRKAPLSSIALISSSIAARLI